MGVIFNRQARCNVCPEANIALGNAKIHPCVMDAGSSKLGTDDILLTGKTNGNNLSKEESDH